MCADMTDHQKYLWHITLDTGHRRKSYHNEVSPAAATLVRQQIDEALNGLTPDIMPGYGLMASTAGGALLATVMAGGEPICTIAVARNSRQSGALWDLIHQDQADASASDDPPQAPWCAVRLHPALNDHVTALRWLGDFERVAAWSWIGP